MSEMLLDKLVRLQEELWDLKVTNEAQVEEINKLQLILEKYKNLYGELNEGQ